jgi:hydroxylamine reductase
MDMFCYQCEQTSKGQGCDRMGVCGKDPETAAMQDLLVHAIKGISQYAHKARSLGASDPEIDIFIVEALFTTTTNVNFDSARIETMIRKAAELQQKARLLYEEACRRAGREPEKLEGPARWSPA